MDREKEKIILDEINDLKRKLIRLDEIAHELYSWDKFLHMQKIEQFGFPLGGPSCYSNYKFRINSRIEALRNRLAIIRGE